MMGTIEYGPCRDYAMVPGESGYWHVVVIGARRIATPDNPQRVIYLRGPTMHIDANPRPAFGDGR